MRSSDKNGAIENLVQVFRFLSLNVLAENEARFIKMNCARFLYEKNNIAHQHELVGFVFFLC